MSDQDGRNKDKTRQEPDNGDDFQPREPYFPNQPPEDLYDDPFANVHLEDGTGDNTPPEPIQESDMGLDDDGIPVLDEWVDAGDVAPPEEDTAPPADAGDADHQGAGPVDAAETGDTAPPSRGDALEPLIADMASELRRELSAVQGYEGTGGPRDTGGDLREEMARTAALEPLLHQIASRLHQELRWRLDDVVREAIEQALEEALQRHSATLQQRIADRLRDMIPDVIDSVFGAGRDNGR